MRFFSIFSLAIFTAAPLLSAAEKSDDKYGEARFVVDAKYLLLPMNGKDNYRKVVIETKDGTVLGEYNALLANGEAAWLASIDISQLKGSEIVVKYEKTPTSLAPKIYQTDALHRRDYSKDRGRPAYHLTAKNGWLGAPYGLVYFAGKWHVFFQENQFAMTYKAPLSWGHATSKDLVNWTYEPNVMNPKFAAKSPIDYPLAASAYYDKKNHSKLFSNDKGGVIFAFTSSTRGECLLVTEDMKTFREVDFNPILPVAPLKKADKPTTSTPNIFFNEDSQLWTIVRQEIANDKKVVAIYTSKDLRKWEKSDELNFEFDSPSMRKMEVIGPEDTPKWVILDGTGKYIVGNFDGKKFQNLSKKVYRIFYGDARGAQFFSNTKEHSHILMAHVEQPGDLMRDVKQSFSQSMSFPLSLRLVKIDSAQYQLRASAADEIQNHYGEETNAIGLPDLVFITNEFTLPDATGNYFMITGLVNQENLTQFSVSAGAATFKYDISTQRVGIYRLNSPKYIEDAQMLLRGKEVGFNLYLDTYTAELVLGTGEMVLFMGDSYINPEQFIKIGALGAFYSRYISRTPILPLSLKERNRQAIDKFKKTEAKK